MKGLFSYVASFGQNVVARFHHADPLKAISAERRQRWTQVITERRKAVEAQKDAEKTTLPHA